jgi:integrase
MKKEDLTAKQVEHAKPDPEKRLELPAGPPKGLYLVIGQSGTKSWAFRYRYRGRTRNLRLTKGYPELKLAAARAEAEAHVKSLEKDIDPAVVQVEETRKPDSAKSVAEEWLKRAVEGTKTHGEVKRIVERDVLPCWPDKLITEIQRPDILRAVDGIVDRGAPILANRALSIIKRWFRWCEERGYVEVSPAARLRPPSNETSRERVLTQDELVEIWKASLKIKKPWGPWFRFLILTAQRRGEVSTMKWDHVDRNKALWVLPAESTKSGRGHDVPLSVPALEVLKEASKFKSGTFVWTTTGGKKSISAYSKAKAAIDAAIQKEREKQDKKEMPSWTVHDLRRTVATHMAKTGVAVHVVSALLEERRVALQSWADYVLSLTKLKAERKRA